MFGGGERVLATQKYTLPIKVGSTKCLLEVLVVPLNLPLLFSVSSMTRAKLAIDFGDKTVRLPDKTVVPYTQASTGHILLDVSHELESVFCHVSFDVVDDKQLMKLHKQFGHCTAEKLHMLIKKSGGSVALADIQKAILQCDICPQFGRSAPKPCASLPLANDWNSTLALDLHQMTELGSSVWYLHIIDLFTRFTAVPSASSSGLIAGVVILSRNALSNLSMYIFTSNCSMNVMKSSSFSENVSFSCFARAIVGLARQGRVTKLTSNAKIEFRTKSSLIVSPT